MNFSNYRHRKGVLAIRFPLPLRGLKIFRKDLITSVPCGK
jgi:hypothetical protein